MIILWDFFCQKIQGTSCWFGLWAQGHHGEDYQVGLHSRGFQKCVCFVLFLVCTMLIVICVLFCCNLFSYRQPIPPYVYLCTRNLNLYRRTFIYTNGIEEIALRNSYWKSVKKQLCLSRMPSNVNRLPQKLILFWTLKRKRDLRVRLL